MRFLITGHTGFKGSWLSLLLLERGHEVNGIALEPTVGSLFDKANLDIIVVSCGFDGHQDDPLEGFNLTDDAYVRITQVLKTFKLPLLFITEGGYSVEAIARCVYKIIEELDKPN